MKVLFVVNREEDRPYEIPGTARRALGEEGRS